jgi:hypothetical protein
MASRFYVLGLRQNCRPDGNVNLAGHLARKIDEIQSEESQCPMILTKEIVLEDTPLRKSPAGTSKRFS